MIKVSKKVIRSNFFCWDRSFTKSSLFSDQVFTNKDKMNAEKPLFKAYLADLQGQTRRPCGKLYN